MRPCRSSRPSTSKVKAAIQVIKDNWYCAKNATAIILLRIQIYRGPKGRD